MKPTITAIGRMIKPKPGQQRLYKVIAVKPDGTIRTIVSRTM